MHRVVPTALVLLAILPQACQRDGTTAPQPLRLGAQVAASPPSTKIAFWSSRDGNAEIYVMNADGSGQTRLTNNPAADYGPSWSPDGRRIAFASTRDGYYPDLYTMAPDGSGVTSLTTEDDHLQIGDDQPSWSPDGLRIAFVHKQAHTDNYLVYVMNADGSGQTPLHYGYYNAHPTWSPDGRKIAFASDQYAEVQIVVMNADGSDAVRLTQQNPPSFEPSWSPDGQRIAFGFTNDGIDLINVDGTGQTPLGVIGGN